MVHPGAITKDTREFIQLKAQRRRSNIRLGKDTQENDPEMHSNMDRDLMGRCAQAEATRLRRSDGGSLPLRFRREGGIVPTTVSPFPWYALTVKHHHEKAVAQALCGRDVESYLPVYRSFHHSGGRQRTVDLPLFPGYVFCRIDINHRLPILTIPGVSSIVSVGRTPAPLPEEEIESVRTMVQSEVTVAPQAYLTAGQAVYIDRGPLQGIQGTLVGSKGEYRLIVAIELLQRAVSAEVDIAWVRPAGARELKAA